MLPQIAWRQAGFANPQGLIAAPVGTQYVQLGQPNPTGVVAAIDRQRIRIFDKVGGGHSNTGWIPRPLPNDLTTITRGGFPAHSTFQGINGGNWVEETFTASEGLVANTPVSGLFRPWYGLYSPAAAGSSLLRWQLTGAPVVQRLDSVQTATNLHLDWDLIVPIFYGPQNLSTDAVPTFANTTIWIAALFAEAVQTAAAMVTNAALYTAFPTALPVNLGNRGVAIRFNTIGGDTGFVPVVANDSGGAPSQTVGTNLVGPTGSSSVGVQTEYELRIRMARGLGGVGNQIFGFSVNHGPEQTIGLAPSQAPGGASYKPLMVYIVLQQNAATAKSIAVGPVQFTAGIGLNLGLS